MVQERSHKRIVGFELLRLVAMLMVLMLHFISQTGSLAIPGTELTPVRVLGGLVESFCIVAVDEYVLISGYFLSKASYRIERPVKLLLQILFYTILIPVVLHAVGLAVYGQDAWTAATYFLPVSMKHYWFATAYVLMYLFSPLLNLALQKITRQQLKITILTLLFFTCFLKSVSPVQLLIDNAGYDFCWFLVLYLIAAYLREYGWARVNTAAKAGCLYLVCSLLTFALHIGLHLIHERTGGLAYYAAVPFHYNSLLCLLAAIGFFQLFRYLPLEKCMREKWNHLILRLSPLTFGVYLIHSHVDIQNRWCGWLADIFGEVPQNAPLGFLWRAIVGVFLAYIICLAIDAVRKFLFDRLAKALSRTIFAKWCKLADEAFHS